MFAQYSGLEFARFFAGFPRLGRRWPALVVALMLGSGIAGYLIGRPADRSRPPARTAAVTQPAPATPARAHHTGPVHHTDTDHTRCGADAARSPPPDARSPACAAAAASRRAGRAFRL